jgi:hypothetical protein
MYYDDEEMAAALLEEEANVAAVDDHEHMEILSALLGMYTWGLKPRSGGSRAGRRKIKPRMHVVVRRLLC